jgi:hypothetical protein
MAVTLGTRLRIARRTFLIFVLCVVGPTLLGAAVAYQAMRSQAHAQVHKRLLESARCRGRETQTLRKRYA